MTIDNKTSLAFFAHKPLPKVIYLGRFKLLLPEIFGFCGGVVHAINLMEETISHNSESRIYLLGEIIHNKNVSDYFSSKGVINIDYDELESIFSIASENDIIVIPAFGIKKELEEKIRRKFLNVVDTTCKDVKKVWDFISAESNKGSTILIHGHPFHPEVEASVSRASDKSSVIILPDMRSAEDFMKHKLVTSDYALANQTTMLYSETCKIETFLRNELEHRGLKLNACQAICKATYMRQIAAEKLLSDRFIDMVFVVGGYDSSNTNNLYKLAKSKHERTFYIKDSFSIKENLNIENYQPLCKKTIISNIKSDISNINTIAILAGASCPVSLVEEVIGKLSKLSKIL